MKSRFISMITVISLLISIIGTFPVTVSYADGTASGTVPTGLLTNELEYPLNVEAPTFGWIVNGEGENVVQTAYQIIVTDEITNTTAWDSRKVESSEQSYIPCGKTLEAGHPYSWKVKTWTKAGTADEVESDYSDEAHFVTGLKTDSDWSAKWISDGTSGQSSSYDKYWYVHKQQSLKSGKTVAKAYAYISGLQDYDLYVNDTEIGRGQSFDYASESRYQGWDITDAVKQDSANIDITALVRTYGGGQGRASADPAFLGHINIYFTDGEALTITTDSTWEISTTTPFNADKTANGTEGDFVEKYIATRAKGGSWTAATEITSPTDTPIAELSKPTAEIVHPVSVRTLKDGTTIADFGKVIPARPEITFSNTVKSDMLTIWGGYVLKDGGHIDTSKYASQSTSMRWVYTPKAGEAQVYDAWNHLAFRYLEIPSCGVEFDETMIAAKIVHTNVPDGRDSTLVTSNEMLNGVYELMKRSALYSMQNSFVDTPTREKGQFTDDARNISEASMATLFEREVSRKAINQFLASADRYWNSGDDLGRYNSVYPNTDGKRDIPEYSVNFPQFVWNYYINTGDKAMLEKAYPYMKNTADYITRNINAATGLVEKLAGGSGGYQYGIVDWPASGRFTYEWSGTSNGARTTVNMLSKHAFDVVALMAAELGNETDKTDMESRSATLKTAINEKLVNSNGLYVDGTSDSNGTKVSNASQHSNSYALAFDIVPEDKKTVVADYVASLGMQQGPMTADLLVKGLFNSDKNAAALKLLTEPNDYGWALEVANDYTFTFESWDAYLLSNEDSQSHGWGSTASSDILKYLAGVENLETGARKIKIAPVYTDLTSLNAEVSTERGKVGVSYNRTSDSFTMTVKIPANVVAEVELPNVGTGKYKLNNEEVENTLTLGSGSYTFVYDGTITPPEAVVYNTEPKNKPVPEVNTDEPDDPEYDALEEYDLVETLSPNESTLDAEYKGQNKDLKLTDWAAIHFGTGDTNISQGNGVDMYNDGSYIKLTPTADGVITLDVKMRKSNGGSSASTIYLSTSNPTSGGTSLHSAVTSDTDLTISNIEVKAGETYYIYNSGGRPTSIKKISYAHNKESFTGIKGTADTANKVYAWEIGSGNANETYSDTSNIVDLTVSLGSGDSLSETEGIVFSGTAVPDNGSVTSRYLLVEPKYDGTLTVNVTGKGTKNNRVYYYDFGTGEVDLSKCIKDSERIAQELDANKATDVSIAMTAGSKYVVYPYTNAAGGIISAISYAYSGETPISTSEPTSELPDQTAEPITPVNNKIQVVSEETEDGKIYYTVKVNGYDDGTLIAAVYNSENSLNSVAMRELDGSLVPLTVEAPDASTAKVKFMLWDGIDTMVPLAMKEHTYTKPQNTEDEASSITLNHPTYPLVVGNSSKTVFTLWEDQGSSFTLTAAVDGGSAASVTWEIEDDSIAYIRDNKTSGESISIRGKRTGVTKAIATASNGDKAECVITVIDNVTRETVETLDFNTNALTLAPSMTATLTPIINPKDVYGNGVLNTNLTWESSDTSVATVSNGVVTAKAAGTATITATSADVGRTAECIVTVAADAQTQTIIADTSYAQTMVVGQSAQLTAEGDNITWKSDNPLVADVDENGVITAYSNSYVPKIGSNGQTVFENGITAYDLGTVKIYATSPTGDTKVFNVKVSNRDTKASSVSIYIDNPVVAVGKTKDITAAILPAREFGKTVTWSSSNEAVATIADSGRTVYGVPKATITGVSAGKTTITANCDGKTDTIEITVTGSEVKVSDIDITNVKEIDIDEVYELSIEATADAANKELAWLSSDSSVLTVNNEGIIKGYKAGTVKVYAIAMDSVSDTVTLNTLLEERTISDISSFLSGKTYKEIEITVKDSSPYLRNLHTPEEGITDSSVNLLWNRASLLDTGDFAAYNVYNGDTKIAENITTLGFTANNLEPDTEYTFRVQAVTASGSELASETIAVTTDKKSPIINVLSYGAKGDGIHIDTLAIQNAIDDCPAGGTVYLPEGYVFTSGALYLKSDMTFKVDGILLGSPYDKDYPATITRWEGWRRLYQTASEWGANSGTDGLTENVHPHASLINAGTYDEGTASHTGAYNIENLTICGKGQINANGFRLGYNEGLNQKTGNGGQPEPMTPALNQTVRGRAITIHNADKVYIKDVTVSYSPSWTIHPIFCRNLTVDRVEVVSTGDGTTGAADDITILNGDGIDPDSSTMVNLFNMDFQTGDDGVAIKTGKDKEGNLLDKPCAYIRVTDCYSHDSKGGVVIGSENASGTHDALFQNLKVTKTTLNHTIWLKGCWSRGGVTHDLLIRDIDGVDKFDIQTTYNTPTNNPADTVPVYKYITFENCNVSFTAMGFNHSISGLSNTAKTRPETYLENFTIRGCDKGGSVDYARNFTITDPAKESNWSFGSHTENMSFVYTDSETNTKLKLTDTATHISSVDNEHHTITAKIGATADEVKNELTSLVNAEITLTVSGTILTVTAEDGVTEQTYTILYAAVWDFAKYTTEVKTTESGFTESYDGLTIAIANNGGDSDHDKITTAGVYWRGGASSGNSARYIAYTPTQNGTLTVTGKVNANNGRLGISDSLVVTSLQGDSTSTTSTSTTTFSKECTAGTTYYIMPKDKSATVSKISYAPKQ